MVHSNRPLGCPTDVCEQLKRPHALKSVRWYACGWDSLVIGYAHRCSGFSLLSSVIHEEISGSLLDSHVSQLHEEKNKTNMSVTKWQKWQKEWKKRKNFSANIQVHSKLINKFSHPNTTNIVCILCNKIKLHIIHFTPYFEKQCIVFYRCTNDRRVTLYLSTTMQNNNDS